MTMFSPNYRRARMLALEIEAARNTLDELRGDPTVSAEELEDLREEINYLEAEFFKTGVSSEYEL